MKKILIITLALAVTGILKAQMAPIDGINQVGFASLTNVQDDTIVTVPYVACLDNDASIVLADLVSTNGLVGVTGSGNAGSADQLIVMTTNDVGLVYYYYYLENGVGWTGLETTKVSDGSTTVIVPPVASVFTVGRGLGFWLKRATGSTGDVYVKGEVSASDPSTTVEVGLNLIGYGTASELNLNGVNWTNAVGVAGAFGSPDGLTQNSDKIIVVNSDGTIKNYYFFDCPGTWDQAYLDLIGKWIDESYTVVTDPIPAGQGFWYQRKGIGSFDFQPDTP